MKISLYSPTFFPEHANILFFIIYSGRFNDELPGDVAALRRQQLHRGGIRSCISSAEELHFPFQRGKADNKEAFLPSNPPPFAILAVCFIYFFANLNPVINI